jgi:Tfp pilus assembly protein PilP
MMRLFTFATAALTMVSMMSSAAVLDAQMPEPRRSAAPVEQPPQPAAAPEAYTYQSEGRRDPFVSLVGTGTDPEPALTRGEGPAAMTVAEISVRGIMQSRGTLVAMVAGPDHKTYIVHPGDKLADGTIKSITPQGMIFIQNVNDPLSLVKQREVSKLLHAVEGK